jgi:hypothetical protein
MLEKIKWDAYSYYKKYGMALVGREWLLPPQYKWDNLQPIIDSIHRYAMTYGAGDYGLNHLGDTACCCGIDEIPGFNHWLKGNFSNIIRKSKGKHIRFDEVLKTWHPKKSIRRILNSNCRSGKESQSMIAYLKDKWNNPGTTNAPDAFLGVDWNGEYDDDGNCLYLNQARTQ